MIKIENKEINSYKSNLKRIRVSSGLTQSDLATLSGINIKSISAYEQEPTKINILSESLNCSIEDLIEKDYIRESLT